MHNISRKYSNKKIFQYYEKHENLKELWKTKKLPRNEKRCAENAKISGEILEKTAHKKCSAVWMAEKESDE
jgi:hypothetical protein